MTFFYSISLLSSQFFEYCGDLFLWLLTPLLSQFFEYCEEAEWVVEVMKTTGKPTAITMSIGPAGDSNNVPPQECAVRLARTGIIRFYEPFPLCGQRH